MASSKEFVEHICDNIRPFGIITYKKIFGEYMIYVNLKPIFLVCDDTVYVKMLDEIKELMGTSLIGHPYKGAKPHYILDVDDIQKTEAVIKILNEITKVLVKKGK